MNEKEFFPAKIEWNESGTPMSSIFGDIYYSNENGLKESEFVFIEGNHLKERFINCIKPNFTIAETGFGTGLNFLTLWRLWKKFKQEHPIHPLQQLHFISFEKFPLLLPELVRCHQQWPELSNLANKLQQSWPLPVPRCHFRQFEQGSLNLDLWFGDVNHCLSLFPSSFRIDAWFLDGFSPKKNPEMWSTELFQQMGRLTRANGTLATYTVAGSVRQGLTNAGFCLKKCTGFGNKREMLTGFYCETK